MLNNKTAIVTGASRGIGKAIALKLASMGANIVINYNRSSKAAEEVVDIIKSNGGNAIAVACDVSKFDEAEKLVKLTVEKFGTVDILVNNAGITRDGLVLRMKEQDFDDVINTNLKGAFNCIRHISPIMLKQRSGRIINISSVVGLVGNAGQLNYSSSKAGLLGMTKSLAKELGSRGVTVNAVAPGFINTDMTEVLSEKARKDTIALIPLKKMGEPEDIAETVGFLSSESARYITGQVINVDGGMVM